MCLGGGGANTHQTTHGPTSLKLVSTRKFVRKFLQISPLEGRCQIFRDFHKHVWRKRLKPCMSHPVFATPAALESGTGLRRHSGAVCGTPFPVSAPARRPSIGRVAVVGRGGGETPDARLTPARTGQNRRRQVATARYRQSETGEAREGE